MSSSPTYTKSVLSMLVLAFITISNLNMVNANPLPQGGGGTSVFSDIDISKTAGLGDAAKAAAERVCGNNLSSEELLRRHRLGEAAELFFFNPRVLDAFNNAPLTKALNCQTNRNKIMKNTCELRASIKLADQCQIDNNTKQIASSVDQANKLCADVDANLLVTVTGITTPAPFNNPRQECGAGKDEKFTSTYKDIDITKTPGGGDAARVAALKVCSANLTPGDLTHRSKLAENIETSFFGPKITAAAGNEPLLKALKCQKSRNKVLKTECQLAADRKINKSLTKFQIDMGILKSRREMDNTNALCAGVDPKFFVDVTA